MASDRAFDLPRDNKRWVIKSKRGLYMAYDYSLYTETIGIAALFIYPHEAKKYMTKTDELVRVTVDIKECS